ncbi:UNKNOWN [Stylonychia lemnae]|uniref:Transmembrane protein n=1 Tax=Stylonychia lemnae TaxID=5949 RepID=A0A078B0G6_STYLE|nr:UNKNOWN [Stylonychia lemnae]|eukprot:CDW87806.1 UNKNOWN [Stylonychia lemnae]
MILLMMLMGFGLFKGSYLYMKLDANISKISLIRTMNDGQIYKPQELGFDFAFGVSSELDPSIGHFTVKQIGHYETDQFDINGKKVMTKIERNLRLDKCHDKHFNFTDQKEVMLKGISNYLCAIDDDYQLQGYFYQQNFEFVEIKLWKCRNSTESTVICRDKQKIDEYFEKETFNFAYINTYFDFMDYDKDSFIKKYIDDSFLFELEAEKIKKLNFYIQLQEAETQDSYVQFGQIESYKFHQISNERTYDDGYSDSEGYIAVVYIRFDMKYDLYSRKIYSLLEYLGDMGGLYRSLLSVGLIIVGQIIRRMFFSDIMHKIYQIRTKSIRDDEDSKIDKKESKNKKSQEKYDLTQEEINVKNIENRKSQFKQTLK